MTPIHRAITLLVVLLFAGCSAPTDAPAPAAPTDATSPTGTSAPPAPTTMTPLPPPTDQGLAAGPRGAEGAPYEIARWEEPAPIPAQLLDVDVTGTWSLRVTGATGSVPPGASVLVAETGSSRGAIVRGSADGSFVADLVGGAGGTVRVVLLPNTPSGDTLQERTHQISHASPSTYVAVPGRTGAGASVTGTVHSGPAWRFDGNLTDEGASVRVRGTLLVNAPSAEPFGVRAFLSRAWDAQGEPQPLYAYATAWRTPSGLPLERVTDLPNPASADAACVTGTSCAVDLAIPASSLPAGGYVALLEVLMGPGPEDPAYVIPAGRNLDAGVPLGVVTRAIAAPMRLAALLFADAPAQAQRGVQARGDAWGWTNRIAWPADTFVLPRTDATGAPIEHTFEPYLPQIMLADRDGPPPPLVRFELPGGSWKVAIRGPDGSEVRLGPAPFAQLVSRTATTSRDVVVNDGGGNVNALARPTTLDTTFRHAFARDGPHVIEIEGTLTDVDGHAYALRGTYDVLVAEPMDVDLGMLPGTPVAVGQFIDRAAQIHPPVPAHLTYRFRLWSGPEAALVMDDVTEGDASAFGWFHPHAGHPLVPTQLGEYRVDVEARHTASDGRLWAASWSFGGVVVDPAESLPVAGRPGIDNAEPRLVRFARSDTGIPIEGTHFNFPHVQGDVTAQIDEDSMEVRVALLDDPSLSLAGIPSLDHVDDVGPSSDDPVAWLDRRASTDEVPLLSLTTTRRDALLGDPWAREAYAYATVERPGVRVREIVKEDYVPNGYWRFNELYSLQPGVGPAGDRPNDYKFLFAGAIVRDATSSRTGAYSALWVETPAGESFVQDPYAPGAVPLFGRVAAFYDITGTRPGSLLVDGDVADFGGYAVPLGAATVFVNLTDPEGATHALSARANPWGHVHDPALNLVAGTAGVWRADVAVVACDAQARCVRGGLNDGSSSYFFYVADAQAPPLPLELPAWLTSAGLEASVVGAAPDGHASAWMPGWLLTSRALAADGAAIDHRPAEITLPNFERSGFRPGISPEQITFTALQREPGGPWRGAAVDTWEGRVLPGGR